MTLSDFIPPMGWIVAFTASVTTAIWVQSEPRARSEVSADQLMPSDRATQGEQEFQLPPRSDVVRAAELFATRPLLAEGRRSFTPEPVAVSADLEPPAPEEVLQEAPDVALEPPNVAMLGTVETGGERRVLFRDKLNGSETWYSIGDAVVSWTIVEILPDRTRLQLQGAEITFTLFGE